MGNWRRNGYWALWLWKWVINVPYSFFEQHLLDSHWQYFKLYKWKQISESAAVYLKYSEKSNKADCSKRIDKNKAAQAVQSVGFIHCFDVVLVDL